MNIDEAIESLWIIESDLEVGKGLTLQDSEYMGAPKQALSEINELWEKAIKVIEKAKDDLIALIDN